MFAPPIRGSACRDGATLSAAAACLMGFDQYTDLVRGGGVYAGCRLLAGHSQLHLSLSLSRGEGQKGQRYLRSSTVFPGGRSVVRPRAFWLLTLKELMRKFCT